MSLDDYFAEHPDLPDPPDGEPCPTCVDDDPEPYCPTCKGARRVRQCTLDGCDNVEGVEQHCMKRHDVCFGHAPDCTGRCFP